TSGLASSGPGGVVSSTGPRLHPTSSPWKCGWIQPGSPRSGHYRRGGQGDQPRLTRWSAAGDKVVSRGGQGDPPRGTRWSAPAYQVVRHGLQGDPPGVTRPSAAGDKVV